MRRYVLLLVLTIVIASVGPAASPPKQPAARASVAAPAPERVAEAAPATVPVAAPVAAVASPEPAKPQPAAKPAKAAAPAAAKATTSVNKAELELLAQMISAESSNQPYDGMVAVGAVIMNRVKSAKFPNTIKDVLYQAQQFESVTNGWLSKTKVTETHRAAALDALRGVDPTNGALYFFAYKKTTNTWLWSRPHKITIGDHRFTA